MFNTFESFLTQKYVDNGGQSPDDEFWDWIEEVPVENIIEWAEEWKRSKNER